jgi:hypothetical protein
MLALFRPFHGGEDEQRLFDSTCREPIPVVDWHCTCMVPWVQCAECNQLFEELRRTEFAYVKAARDVVTNWSLTAREFLILQTQANDALSKKDEARLALKEHQMECHKNAGPNRDGRKSVSLGHAPDRERDKAVVRVDREPSGGGSPRDH